MKCKGRPAAKIHSIRKTSIVDYNKKYKNNNFDDILAAKPVAGIFSVTCSLKLRMIILLSAMHIFMYTTLIASLMHN